MNSKSVWLLLLAIILVVSGAVVFKDLPGSLTEATAAPELANGSRSAAAPSELEPAETPSGLAKATFASGCFWCSDALFRQLKGVKTVVVGYSGGSIKNPSYEAVCTGTTGHAEAIQVTYDPAVVSYQDLLEVFWKTHDPTTLNRQGHDVGPQYRSAIFYHSDEQKKLAELYKKKLNDSKVFDNPIVTEIAPFKEFYRAEDYHQNYYAGHSQQPYCQMVIAPKMEKLKKVFHDKLQ